MEKTTFELIYDVVKQIPCHRVVNRLGEVSKTFAFGGENRQVDWLTQEGVGFQDGKVDLQKYGCKQMTFEMMEKL